jgi:hypothetical protein
MTEKLDLSQRASESKKSIGRSVSINGVHAVDLDIKRSENLNDPLVDINFKVNNPIGRLWLALKRIWRSQNTVLNFRFTIPLLVLPIAIYILWLFWEGRGASIPMSKLGVIHEVKIEDSPRDILILPTSDVYVLDYASNFNFDARLTEKPVVVVGTYRAAGNVLRVESLIPYSQLDLPNSRSVPSTPRSVWDTIWDFITQFR